VVVLGSINIDIVVSTAKIARPGETVLAGKPVYLPGGKGANQAVAAARAGGDVVLIGCTGQDEFGHRLRQSLAGAGVGIDYVRQLPDTPTGMAFVAVDNGGENAITVSSGANSAVTPDHVDRSRHALAGARVAITQLEVPVDAVERFADFCCVEGVPLVLNAAPFAELPAALLHRTACLVVNREEASDLTGLKISDRDSARRALEAAAALGPRNVVVTLGADGAVALSQDQFIDTRGYPAELVDSTGAGDAFVGALGVALARGNTLADAVLFASAAGAIACGYPGAQGEELTAGRIAELTQTRPAVLIRHPLAGTQRTAGS
jgi:ribokinase